MHHLRTLIAAACLVSLFGAHGQSVPCPGEPLIFEVEGEYYGTKTWEYSADGVTWSTADVAENTPFTLQPEQSGWYRVRFHDETCDINYVSEAQRFVAHTIDLGSPLTIAIGGVVKTEFGLPVFGATVRAGCGSGVSSTTDHYGVFRLDGVIVRDGLATLTVEKEGYFTGSRSFVPAESAEEVINYTQVTLLQKNLAGTVDGTTGGDITLEGLTITFPANAVIQDGTPYTGPVSVYLNHIDPTSEDLHGQMPGMLMGVQDDQPQLLYSYGMAGVELADAAGNAVQLAPGNSATVRFPVQAAQQAAAPTSIPLWWFDEDLGYWVEEGEAQRVGNEYVGQVAHFSWWNCDVPGNFVLLKGNVLDQVSGAILANAQIRLISATMGSGITYSNGAGEFEGMVPIGQMLTLQVWLPCGPAGTYVLVHEEVVGPFAAGSEISVLVDSPDLRVVTGQVLDCGGVPVEQGYGWINGQVVFCTEGSFEFNTCASSVNLRAVDMTTGNVSSFMTIELTADTTDVGDLTTCAPLFGSVTDIDGNLYPTVIIGEQEWMAANLKTTRDRDGVLIPNVVDWSEWRDLSSAAWCNYVDDPSNDAVYGKLYNGYAVTTLNLCPQEWHVPTDMEWQELELALGMPSNTVDQLNWRGSAMNVGGKMKHPSLWLNSDAGNTDESAFSAIPGGMREWTGFFDGEDGPFPNLSGFWWSSTVASPIQLYHRHLQSSAASNIESGVKRGAGYYEYGFSVRCVRD